MACEGKLLVVFSAPCYGVQDLKDCGMKCRYKPMHEVLWLVLLCVYFWKEYVCVFVCMYVHMFMYIYVFTCVCLYVCTYASWNERRAKVSPLRSFWSCISFQPLLPSDFVRVKCGMEGHTYTCVHKPI